MSAKVSVGSRIIEQVGGVENITHLTHCATRLRFELRDASVVSDAAVDAIPEVMGVVRQDAHRYQVIVGGAVNHLYVEMTREFPELGKGGADTDPDAMRELKAELQGRGPRGKFAWLNWFFEFLADSFRPVLGAMLGASIFITVMALLATLKVIPAWNAPGVTLDSSLSFVNLAWQAVFVFLPLMVAYNATKKVGADPWVGFSIMAVMMLPAFTQLAGADAKLPAVVDVFGLPLTIFNYSSQVFPPLLMALLLGPLYAFLRKVIPSNLQVIFVPFLSMLVMIPVTAFILAPLGVYAGSGIGNLFVTVNGFSPLIFAVLVGALYPFLVITGTAWSVVPIMFLNISTLGYDFIQGPMGAWNFGCFGVTAGVLLISIRRKNAQMEQVAGGALTAGLLGGISEPSLYGVHLRFAKRTIPAILAGSITGAFIMGLGGGVTTNAFLFTSLLTIPAFNNIPLYAIGISVAFLVSMLTIATLGYEGPNTGIFGRKSRGTRVDNQIDNQDVPRSEARHSAGAPLNELVAPVNGTVIALSEVPDPVFAGGTLGDGFAIEPRDGRFVAPVSGKVVTVFPTGHAYGIRTDAGVDVLIHIGMDTVKLNGEGFTTHVSKGDQVSAGDPLCDVNLETVAAAGYSTVTPVVITTKKAVEGLSVSAGPADAGTTVAGRYNLAAAVAV
ncbi:MULTISPECIES: glucose PTS transporter subunit IIA [unclassified Arthrobacter]|uniref:glucose PTS transporter subunit IIA n=1 Tax=unclassified Arthrobacter TaxID=235627 RepID=UPI001C85783F|nr:glucose PTS transporter subunit IIA [Arthrobacter sp. MAHUQ-56]MBX7445947.1 glucose PTS transporter subunit IIA [Arthrobacter sp. MAHUQ-56]